MTEREVSLRKGKLSNKKLFKSGNDVINLDTIPYALDDAAQLLRKSGDYNAYEWATLGENLGGAEERA